MASKAKRKALRLGNTLFGGMLDNASKALQGRVAPGQRNKPKKKRKTRRQLLDEI